MKNLILLFTFLVCVSFVKSQDFKIAECKIINTKETVFAFIPKNVKEGDSVFIEYELNFKGCVANWIVCKHNNQKNKNYFTHTITVWNSSKGKSELRKVKVYKAVFVKEKHFDPIIN